MNLEMTITLMLVGLIAWSTTFCWQNMECWYKIGLIDYNRISLGHRLRVTLWKRKRWNCWQDLLLWRHRNVRVQFFPNGCMWCVAVCVDLTETRNDEFVSKWVWRVIGLECARTVIFILVCVCWCRRRQRHCHCVQQYGNTTPRVGEGYPVRAVPLDSWNFSSSHISCFWHFCFCMGWRSHSWYLIVLLGVQLLQ